MAGTQRAKRADAERNRAAILAAGLQLLGEDPAASMSDIAKAAGVSRVTMYGHFSSRAELVHALMEGALGAAHRSLSTLDLGGDPMAALRILVTASWRIVGPARMLLRAAAAELGDEEVRALHEDPMELVASLVERGRASGAFRTDVPARWLVACYQSVLHGAAEELRAGRLAEEEADAVVWATIRSLVGPPR